MWKGRFSRGVAFLGFMIICCLLAHGLANATTSHSDTVLYELTASDGEDNDRFGGSMAMDGDTAIVGAASANSAYVFHRRPDGSWGEVKRLSADDTIDPTRFGSSVDISANTVVIGADITKVVYVFERNAGIPDSWSKVKKLATDGGPEDGNGFDVAIDLDTLVIGYPEGNVAYVHVRDSGGSDHWGRVKTLKTDEVDVWYFGGAVAISEDLIAVTGADVGGPIVVYLFQRDLGDQDNWGQLKKLTLDDDGGEEDVFEAHELLALEDNTLIVGAYDATVEANDGVNPGQGVAYLFERDFGGPGNWGRVKKLVASDGAEYEWFGYSVAISGDKVIVGAVWADIEGNDRQGAAYIFQRDVGGPSNWGEVEKLFTSAGAAREYFGASVATSLKADLISAPGTSYDGGENQGKAYFTKRLLTQPWVWLPMVQRN